MLNKACTQKLPYFSLIPLILSQSLANDFSSKFTADGNQIVKTEEYTVGQKGQGALPQLLQDAESKNPDMIYFSGYAADISILLTDLPTSGPYATLPVMGGDALYELGYPSNARAGFSHLRFTSFAYPDEWDNLHLTAQKPAFFNDYAGAFGGSHPGGQYGFTRADGDVILSYDAMSALLTASNNVLKTKQSFTPDDIRQALLQITGSKAIQGVSGQISFGSNGDPIKKAIVVLFVDPNGHIQLKAVEGCFLVGKCS